MQRNFLWLQTLISASIGFAAIVCSFSVLSSDIKIGIVNTVKILRESAPTISAQKKIEKEFSPREEQIKKMAANVEALQKQLEDESKDLNETEQREMERKLATLSREYQRAQRQLQEDFSMRQNDERGLIVEHINEAINKIAELENYDLIFHLQDTVYRSERIDITDQVMKALEDK
ncbi:MAG: OmpH family outer membrane protein [Nitrosomonas sp.]|nr:OmpH family outer membrane protein [Nitrosomonas sp.]